MDKDLERKTATSKAQKFKGAFLKLYCGKTRNKKTEPYLAHAELLAVQQSLKILPHLHLLHVGFMVLLHRLLSLTQAAAQVFLLLDLLGVHLSVIQQF